MSLYENPVELRFIDLFLLIIAALIFVTFAIVLPGLSHETGPQIVTRALPDAIAGSDYDVPLAAAGGTGTLRWRLIAGTLPAGLTFENGAISGRGLQGGASTFTVAVADEAHRTVEQTLSLRVRAIEPVDRNLRKEVRIALPAIALPDGSSGQPYHARLRASEPAAPRWTIAGGALPQGLTLAPDGSIFGVPSVAPLDPWLDPFDEQRRALARRRAGTARFTIAIEGGRRIERRDVVLYVEPAPYSLLGRILTGDLLPDDSRLLQLVLWWLVVGIFLTALFFAALPLGLFALGFPRVALAGWRGVLVWRVVEPRSRNVGALRASFAVAASRFIAFLRALLRFFVRQVKRLLALPRLIVQFVLALRDAERSAPEAGGSGTGGGSGEPSTSSEQDAPWTLRGWLFPGAEPELPDWLPQWVFRGRQPRDQPPAGEPAFPPTASGGIAPPMPKRKLDEQYLESLRRGGSVRYGGAFLLLPFIDELEIERLTTDVATDPKHGQGLLHVLLDELLRCAAGASRRRGAERLDPRFDVILSRSGPAAPLHPNRGRPDQAQTGGVQAPMVVPHLDAGDPMRQSMRGSAAQAQEWLAAALPPNLGERRRAIARSLLRRTAYVRLEGAVIHVRFSHPFNSRGENEVQQLFETLNARSPRTIGWMSYPLHFAFGAGD